MGKQVKKADPLFPARPRNFRIGGDIRPKGRDLSRFVKWPAYIRLQRQRKILYERLKVPPSINQFTSTLDKNQATELFKLLGKYRPESAADKKERIRKIAEEYVKKDLYTDKSKATSGKAPTVIKFGLKHVTHLIEEGKAKMVCIANDVQPLELVVCLPALWKNKARLGALVHKKTAAVVCLTGVNKEDSHKLDTLKSNSKAKFNDDVTHTRKWGGGIMGRKTQSMLEKRAKALEEELAKKLQNQY